MIYGSQFNYPVNRIQPVDADRQDDQRDEKKRKVLYQGRAWAEAEEEEKLAVKHAIPQTPTPEKVKQGSITGGVYANQALLERAKTMFNSLTTLEEKAAQLCFLSTEAIYDPVYQHNTELLIQTWQIGGLLFRNGDYRRQTFLIERYQEISKTPLLMTNDFLHGLSFYLQGSPWSEDSFTEQHFSDLGKAVMAQNRRLGVHIQFDRQRAGAYSSQPIVMDQSQAKAFRRGIREAQGVVAKEKSPSYQDGNTAKGNFPFLTHPGSLTTTLIDYQVQETLGFKTLTFFDASVCEKENLESALLEGFMQLCDVFLVSENISEAIRALASLVRSGKVGEEVIDRHVMKALIIKSLYF